MVGDLADYNVFADALSRLNLPESFDPEETFKDKIINTLEIDNIEDVLSCIGD